MYLYTHMYTEIGCIRMSPGGRTPGQLLGGSTTGRKGRAGQKGRAGRKGRARNQSPRA